METYKALTPARPSDIGTALQELIVDNLRTINTSFIAKITRINGNKVSIIPALKKRQTDAVVTINNCMVGFAQSGEWHTQHKLKVGDYGLAIIAQNDITRYKENGKTGLNATLRRFDIQDAIFIPFSLFDTLPNDAVNYVIKNTGGTCSLEFDNEENGTLKAKLLTLQSETTTLKIKLAELATILENALISQTPSGTQPFSGGTVAAFGAWKSSLDTLFKD